MTVSKAEDDEPEDLDPLCVFWLVDGDTVGEALSKAAAHYYSIQMSLPPEPGQGSEMIQIVSPALDAVCWCCGEPADIRRSTHVQHREDAKSVLVWFSCGVCADHTVERCLGGAGGLTGFGLSCYLHIEPSVGVMDQAQRQAKTPPTEEEASDEDG